MAQGVTGYIDIGDSTYSPSRLKLRIHYSESYDVSTNQSVVTITKLQAMSVSPYSWYGVTYYPGGTISIGGVTTITMDSAKSTHAVSIQNFDTWYDFSGALGSVTVDHNSDGSKTVSISAAVRYYTKSGGAGNGANLTGSQNVQLTTIPRASQFGTISGNTIGESISVSISRASTDFTHRFWYKVGNASWAEVPGTITDSVTFTPDISYCSQFPNTESGNMQMCIGTYSGDTQIGDYVYKTITVYVPRTVTPTAELQVTGKKLFGSWYLTGRSYAEITANAEGSYGSTIKSITITCSPYTNSSSDQDTCTLITGVFNAPGNLSVSCTVTDSRGRSIAKGFVTQMLDYSYPRISVQQCTRCYSDGSPAMDGSYIKLLATFSCAPVNWLGGDRNHIACKVSYRVRGYSAWQGETDITSNTSATVFGNINPNKAYEVRFRAVDTVGEVAESVLQLESSALNIIDAVPGKIALNGAVDESLSEGVQIVGDLHVTGNVDALVWKSVAVGGVGDVISLPQNFNELHILVYVSDSMYRCYTTVVPKAALIADFQAFYVSGYSWSSSDFGSARVDLSLTQAKLSWCTYLGVSNGAAKISIRYR